MPFKENIYTPPFFLFNRHLETIYPAVLRRVDKTDFTVINIDTPDDDFLQLDWYRTNGADKVVIISHGLEGNSTKAYVRGMANAFLSDGWGAIAWNYRGCGSTMNKKEILYHSGATYDLETVVNFAKTYYKKIFLVGFSLGGNITLKYMGEQKKPPVAGAIAFSTPIDLYSCSLQMEKPYNKIYTLRFLYYLKKKIKAKEHLLNGKYPFNRLDKIKTILEFDETFTAPLHGFKGAIDYYEKCSSLQFLEAIDTPSLLVNSINDPFLSHKCFPKTLSEKHPYFFFESTNRGGHLGFSAINNKNMYWSEKRALEFANSPYLE